MRSTRSVRVLCGLVAVLFFGAQGYAQTNADINSGLQFSFIPPGARSLAMGGAFTGMAADATAAWTNPAGLVVLTKSEVSLEVRHSKYENEFPSGGTLSDPGIGEESSATTGVAFASVVLPVRNSRWTFAVFYHELANFEAALDAEEIRRPDGAVLSDRVGQLELEIPGFGGAAAVRLTDHLSAGLSVVAYSYSLDSVTTGSPNPGSPPDATEARQILTGDDDGVGGTVGLQWSKGDWTLGGVYRLAPEFDADYAFICGNRTDAAGGASLCRGVPDGTPIAELSGTSKFKAPDSYGIGVAFQATERLVIASDVIRVLYSQLGDETKLITTQGLAEDFYVDDVTEVRLGAEYHIPLAGARGIFLRAGAWLEPDHRLHYAGDNDNLMARFNTVEDDQVHASMGIGFSAGARVSFDLAADLAESADTFSLSTVVRF